MNASTPEEDSEKLPALESDSQSSHSTWRSINSEDVNTLQEPPSDFVVDKALSSELMGLSLETRLAIEEEIHGVVCEKEEPPAFLDKKLEEFDRLLNANKAKAQEQARQDSENREQVHRGLLLRNVIRTHGENNNNNNNNCYLNDPHLRLRFLRSESFDVQKAVTRMICFLEFTSELYGDFVADRPIALSDFSKEEEYYLRHSRSQYLPFRDRSGRRVQVGVGSINFHVPLHIRFKIIIFLQWIVSEDIETQRKGICIVLWPFDEKTDTAITTTTSPSSSERKPKTKDRIAKATASDKDNKLNWKRMRRGMTKETTTYHRKYNNSSPVRIASIQQYFQDTPFFRAMSALYIFYGLKKEYWSLYRSHFGQEIQLRYQLSNYGIPEALMPMTTTGKVKTDFQSSWVSMLKVKEQQQKKKEQQMRLSSISGDAQGKPPQQEYPEIVECPSSNDVVFRKGRPLYKRNPGNMQYRELIAAASNKHSEAGRSGKYAISWKIVQQIESKGGRFLEWTPLDHGSGGMWIVMTDRKAIREKIASALKQYNRDHFRTTINNKNKTNVKTSHETKTNTPKKPAQPKGSKNTRDNQQLYEQHPSTATPVTASDVLLNFRGYSAASAAIPSNESSYLFLPNGHLAYSGSTKRRKTNLFCDGIATDCPQAINANMRNNSRIPANYLQSNNEMNDLSLFNAMMDFNTNVDSSPSGNYFFPTG